MKKTSITFLFLLIPALVGAQIKSRPRIDLIWEAQTYTPANYRGRGLATPSSLVKVMAVVPNHNLTFYWRKDGFDAKSASGAGKNTFNYRSSDTIGGSDLIEVLAIGADGSTIGAGSVRIPIMAPQIIFYKVENGQINYHQALKKLNITTDQMEIAAEPFYFSTPDWRNRRLSFNWATDEQKIVPKTEDPRFLTFLTRADSGVGKRLIDLKIINNNNQFQVANAKLPVNFGLSSFTF